jgi:hypothetical protein
MLKKGEASAFIRAALIRNPKATNDELRAEWTKAKLPEDQKPSDPMLSGIRFNMRTKYGVKSLTDLPRLPQNAGPDVVGLLAILIKSHNHAASQAQIKNYVRADGIDFTDQQFVEAKARAAGKPVPTAHPDPAKGTGPRARIPGIPGRPPSVPTPPPPAEPTRGGVIAGSKPSISRKYDEIERMLEEVRDKARDLGNDEVIEALRGAIRTTIIQGHLADG